LGQNEDRAGEQPTPSYKIRREIDYMNNTTAYLVDDKKQVDTLEEVRKLVGEHIHLADIYEGGSYSNRVKLIKKGVDDKMMAKALKTSKDEVKGSEAAVTPKITEGVSISEIVVPEKITTPPAVDPSLVKEDTPPEDVPPQQEGVSIEELVSTVPHETLDELKGFIKDIDTDTLEFIANTVGAKWSTHANAPINRMRIAMALKTYFFPELFAPKEESGKKKKPKYADLTTERLLEMAKSGNLEIQKTGHPPIDRMKAIVALKNAGLLPK